MIRKLAEFFKVRSTTFRYTLSTLTGSKTQTEGVTVEGLRVKGVKETKTFDFPSLLTNPFIPDCRDEAASPGIVSAHPHLRHLSSKFCEKNDCAEVLLLIGRDASRCMYTRSYGSRPPYAHHTALGWALVGNSCQPSGVRGSGTVLKSTIEHFSNKPIFELPSKTLDAGRLFICRAKR